MFLKNLKNNKEKIDKKLEVFFDKELQRVQKINATSYEILVKIKKISLNGGKRIRPILALKGFEMSKTWVKNSDSQKTLIESYSNSDSSNSNLEFLQLSLELFQTFCLIHDDIMDQAQTRRGFLTINAEMKEEFKYFSEFENLSISYALLAGDYAHFLADELFSKIEVLSLPHLKELFYQMQLEVTSGQIDDTFGVGLSELDKIKEEDVIKMLDYKSGRYSIEKPFLLGIQLNLNFSIKQILNWFENLDIDLQQEFWKSPKQSLLIWEKSNFDQQSLDFELVKKVIALSKICRNLGLIFQIKDDILGVFGNEEKTGKSNSSDLEEGKRTLLVIKTFKKAKDLDKQKIKQILGKKPLSDNDLKIFQTMCQDYKVLEELEDFCKLLGKEIDFLLERNFDLEQVKFLQEFKRFLWERQV